jgi:hypothetical protein
MQTSAYGWGHKQGQDMGRQTKRLTARVVATLTKPGRHADGGNLYLNIEKNGGGRRWVFLFERDSRPR